MGRLEPASLNRTENFVRFQGPLAERSDGFSGKCAILFRTSHPAAARFRRSFRISVCKMSLISLCGGFSQITWCSSSGARQGKKSACNLIHSSSYFADWNMLTRKTSIWGSRKLFSFRDY